MKTVIPIREYNERVERVRRKTQSCGAGKHKWEPRGNGMPIRQVCTKCGLSGPRDSQDRHWTAGLP